MTTGGTVKNVSPRGSRSVAAKKYRVGGWGECLEVGKGG